MPVRALRADLLEVGPVGIYQALMMMFVVAVVVVAMVMLVCPLLRVAVAVFGAGAGAGAGAGDRAWGVTLILTITKAVALVSVRVLKGVHLGRIDRSIVNGRYVSKG